MNSAERVDPKRANDDMERKAIEDVMETGIHIVHVFDEKEEAPCFSYTVGLWHTHKHPEVLIVGLKDDLCHEVLNDLNRDIANGQCFTGGLSATEVLEGFRVYLEDLAQENYAEYLGWNRWFYDGNDFEAVQLVWPDTSGVFPWESGASEYMRWAEPILTKIPLLVN